ncbi:MAB_1171c family putative transporter [Streptomyces sp. NPDC047014]|uniref:MAB_1171c family putative transporter n=1 Tax=Streptomyces sp. NPDC047014 TaxID=3155736 RepID=UPI0033D39A5C
MDGSDYYIPALVLAVALLVRMPSLWQNRNSPMARAIFVIIAASGAGFVFAAPPTVERVNRLTGVPNVSALIVYSFLSCLSCASLVLLIHWRGGRTVRRQTRLWIATTCCILLTFCVLFTLSEVPLERPRDLDTFYSTTPYIREMIVLYLTSHAATATVVMTKCWRWSKELRAAKADWTRWGLLILVTAFGLGLAFALLKFAAVGAHWAGTDTWDWLSTDIAPPLAGLGAAMTTVGFLVPVVGPRLQSAYDAWRAYRRMEPLWRALGPWGSGARMRIPLTSSAEMRATLRATEIADRLLRLAPSFDAAHQEAAERYAAAKGYGQEAVLFVTEAFRIRAALLSAPAAANRATEAAPAPVPAPATLSASAPASPSVRISGIDGLARLSRHFSEIHETGTATGTATTPNPAPLTAPADPPSRTGGGRR